MNRIEFTAKLADLLTAMVAVGESVILDYVLRSHQEQRRLFDAGLSKCDGEKTISAHQTGRAVDLYFIRDGKLGDPINGWEFWHLKWKEVGGKPMIEWDKGHFEG